MQSYERFLLNNHNIEIKNVEIQMNNKQSVLYVDGSCKFNNVKDQSKRKMWVCFVDNQIPGHKSIHLVLPDHYPISSNNIAELIAVRAGMQYAISAGYKELLIKLDSNVAYCWVKNGRVSNKINDPKAVRKNLDRINKMKPWFDKFELEVVGREINKAGQVLEQEVK